MQTKAIGIIDAGVDWVTCTQDHPDEAEKLFLLGRQILADEVEFGNFARPWRFAGYQGYRAGHAELGFLEKSVIVRLGSVCAAANWRDCVSLSSNVSRIDLQVTARDESPAQTVIARHYNQARRWAKLGRGQGALSRIQTDDGPTTLYFNRRVSDRFGRIYDKGAESGLEYFQDAVRYEVEFKGHVAAEVAHNLYTDSSSTVGTLGYVIPYYAARGISPRFAGEFGRFNGNGSNQLIASPIRTPRSSIEDHDRSLEWLRTQCRGTVERLVRAGKLGRVLVALSLDVALGFQQDSAERVEAMQYLPE